MLSTRMRELREKNGYSQQDIADMLGVVAQQYYRWESGKNEPKSAIVTRLAHIYGVSTDYLYGKENTTAENITEENLSTVERALVVAFRKGRIWDVIELLADTAPESAKSLQRIVGESERNKGE